MCRRFALFEKPVELFGDMDIIASAFAPRYNIAPTQTTPVIVQDNESGPAAFAMSWGKGRPGVSSPMVICARSESIAHKPSLRSAFKARRCLIPANGYYQWTSRADSGTPLPYYCTPDKADAPMAFAGLWAAEPGADGLSQTFAVITTAAADAVRPIHERMPVTIPRIHWRRWLDPRNHDYFGLLTMLLPTMSVGLRCWKVGDWVSDTARDCQDCIARVA
ncbi:MAG: SOS response-associated peptidase [Planctomycetaceae bacterium]|nr:SOS response-associated peptidase [Planctomycetaceae bacterium]